MTTRVDVITKRGGSTGEMSGFERSGMSSGLSDKAWKKQVQMVNVERISRMISNHTELFGRRRATWYSLVWDSQLDKLEILFAKMPNNNS